MKMKFVPFWSRLSGYLWAICGFHFGPFSDRLLARQLPGPMAKGVIMGNPGSIWFISISAFIIIKSAHREIAKLGRSECPPLQGGNLAKTSGPKR